MRTLIACSGAALVALLARRALLVSLAGCVDPAPPPPNAVEPEPEGGGVDVQERRTFEVSVATWNVRRFFDTQCDSGTCGGGDFEALPTQEEFDARADQIAAAILNLDADVVLLQEIESEQCMEALRARMGEAFNVSVLGETRLAGSVDTALFSRGALIEVRKHRQDAFALPDGGQTKFERELLEVHLEIDTRRVVVFVAHFKSKSNDDPDQRLAEATRSREIVLGAAERLDEALVVLGGDLNDTPGSAPLNALESDGALTRVAEDLDPDSWTHIFRGNIAALDHLYLMRDRGVYVPGSAEVFRDGNGASYGGSDHAALRARFELE